VHLEVLEKTAQKEKLQNSQHKSIVDAKNVRKQRLA
jgi:hypothetical protein